MSSRGIFNALFFVTAAVFIVGMFSGCGFWSSPSGVVTDELVTVTNSGPANVRFQIELPGTSRTDSANLSIRGDVSAPTVTFKLLTLNSGSPTNQTHLLLKTVTVTSGKAEASFPGLPLTTVIGEIVISGGNLGGKNEFHGATDLVSGDNVLTVSPKGSGMPSDLLARAVRKISLMTDMMSVPLPGLTESLKNANTYLLTATPSANFPDQMVEGLLHARTYSLPFEQFSVSGTGTISITRGGQKTTPQLLAGTGLENRNFAFAVIHRHCFGGFGYLGWAVNATGSEALYVLGRVSSQGALLGSLPISGGAWVQGPTLFLRDGSLLMSGMIEHQPVVFRWNGKTSQLKSGQESQFSEGWVRKLGTAGTGSLYRNRVEFLELDLATGRNLSCLVRDPVTLQTRVFQIDIETGAEIGVSGASGIGLWATPRAGAISVGWESVPDAVYYNLYWSDQKTLDKNSHLGKVTHAVSPYLHAGLSPSSTYFFRVTWIDGTGAESAESEVAQASPLPIETIPTATDSLVLYGTQYGSVWVRGSNGHLYIWNPYGNTSQTLVLYATGTRKMGEGFIVDEEGNQWQMVGPVAAAAMPSIRSSILAATPPLAGMLVHSDSYLRNLQMNFTDLRLILPGGNSGVAFQETGSVWGWQFSPYQAPKSLATFSGVMGIQGSLQPTVLFQDGRLESFDPWLTTRYSSVDLLTQGISDPVDHKKFRVAGDAVLDKFGQVNVSTINPPCFRRFEGLSGIRKMGDNAFLRENGKVAVIMSRNVFRKRGSLSGAEGESDPIGTPPESVFYSIQYLDQGGGLSNKNVEFNRDQDGGISYAYVNNPPPYSSTKIAKLSGVASFIVFGGYMVKPKSSVGIFSLHGDGTLRETLLASRTEYVIDPQATPTVLLTGVKRILTTGRYTNYAFVEMNDGRIFQIFRNVTSTYVGWTIDEETRDVLQMNLTVTDIKKFISDGSYLLKDGRLAFGQQGSAQCTIAEAPSKIVDSEGVCALLDDGRLFRWRMALDQSTLPVKTVFLWNEVTEVANPVRFYRGQVVDSNGDLWGALPEDFVQDVPGVEGATDVSGNGTFGIARGSTGGIWGWKIVSDDPFVPYVSVVNLGNVE